MNNHTDCVDEVIINEELARRQSRPPNYEAESRALIALAEIMAISPDGILITSSHPPVYEHEKSPLRKILNLHCKH